jgi:predicted dithiol-disulfide oxidoreductase (DUF899 family)
MEAGQATAGMGDVRKGRRSVVTGWCRGGGGGRDHRNRLGWTFPWFSSHGSEFNYDFHVTFDPSITPVEYNYRDYGELVRQNPSWEGYTGSEEGASAFLRQGDRVFHTYSCFGRGIDLLNGTYNWLDLTARGRQEDWEQPPGRSTGPAMSWLRRHDKY